MNPLRSGIQAKHLSEPRSPSENDTDPMGHELAPMPPAVEEDYRTLLADLKAPSVPEHLPRVASSDGLTGAAYQAQARPVARVDVRHPDLNVVVIEQGQSTEPARERREPAVAAKRRKTLPIPFYVVGGAAAFLALAFGLYAVVHIALRPKIIVVAPAEPAPSNAPLNATPSIAPNPAPSIVTSSLEAGASSASVIEPAKNTNALPKQPGASAGDPAPKNDLMRSFR